jgi:hypothetical protein
MWLKMETKPVWSTLQLLIFPSCRPTRGNDALFRRFGSQQVACFVGPPWIFHLFLGIGIAAKIRWGGIDVVFEPRGAESRSILPRYVSKNGIVCECNVPIMWNPLHSHIWTRKTKTSSFSSTSPFNYHYLHRYINLRQIDDTKASVRMVCTQTDTQKHSSGY